MINLLSMPHNLYYFSLIYAWFLEGKLSTSLAPVRAIQV
jgi:hypothetical protein